MLINFFIKKKQVNTLISLLETDWIFFEAILVKKEISKKNWFRFKRLFIKNFKRLSGENISEFN